MSAQLLHAVNNLPLRCPQACTLSSNLFGKVPGFSTGRALSFRPYPKQKSTPAQRYWLNETLAQDEGTEADTGAGSGLSTFWLFTEVTV